MYIFLYYRKYRYVKIMNVQFYSSKLSQFESLIYSEKGILFYSCNSFRLF